jgi:hypothetical protein
MTIPVFTNDSDGRRERHRATSASASTVKNLFEGGALGVFGDSLEQILQVIWALAPRSSRAMRSRWVRRGFSGCGMRGMAALLVHICGHLESCPQAAQVS